MILKKEKKAQTVTYCTVYSTRVGLNTFCDTSSGKIDILNAPKYIYLYVYKEITKMKIISERRCSLSLTIRLIALITLLVVFVLVVCMEFTHRDDPQWQKFHLALILVLIFLVGVAIVTLDSLRRDRWAAGAESGGSWCGCGGESR